MPCEHCWSSTGRSIWAGNDEKNPCSRMFSLLFKEAGHRHASDVLSCSPVYTALLRFCVLHLFSAAPVAAIIHRHDDEQLVEVVHPQHFHQLPPDPG